MATCHYTSCGKNFSAYQGTRYCSKLCQLLTRIEMGDHGDITPRDLYLHWLKKNNRLAEYGEGIGFILTIERKES